MRKFFKKHRKFLVTCAVLSMLCVLFTVCVAAEDPDATGGFGNVLNQFIAILVDGISGMGEGLGEGVNTYVSSLFFTVDSNGAITGLSHFGGTAAIFGE